MNLGDYLTMLRDNGLGTLPGTAAEILDDEVRHVLSRNKLSTAQWKEVISTAHTCGIRTTSTLMYGHIETAEHWVNQLLLLRGIHMRANGAEIVGQRRGRDFGPDLSAFDLSVAISSGVLCRPWFGSVRTRRSGFLRHCKRVSHDMVPEEKNSVRHPRGPGRRTARMPRERQQPGKLQSASQCHRNGSRDGTRRKSFSLLGRTQDQRTTTEHRLTRLRCLAHTGIGCFLCVEA